jgi:hypothetical protein
MKKKDFSKTKIIFRREDELSKPPKKRLPREKKKPHHFKPWQIDLSEEE